VPTRALSSDTRTLRRLRDAVRDDLIRTGAANEAIEDAVLCVHEACMNSIQHGKGEARVRWEVSDDLVTFQVCDEGDGLSLPSPEVTPATGQQSGRGLFLIRRLSDRFETSAADAQRCLTFSVRLVAGGRMRTLDPAGFAIAN
jgi:anti-sigma regulatory factor (Ser/Thr protein kinase)